MQVHTLIGAGGSVGSPLAQELLSAGQSVRLLSRSGKGAEGAESRAVDVFNKAELKEAVKGSKVAYLLVGLEYSTKAWQEQWPVLMDNVMDACASANVPLIFFDNVYMYGPVEGKMTEETPYNPCSKKGEVRAKLATKLMEAAKRGDITASIARGADFYGPWASNTSLFYQVALKNLSEGKKAQWLGNPKAPHTFSYTLDCAKALVLLANDPTSFNQIWHVPSSNPPLTPEALIRLAAAEMGVPFKGIQAAPKFLVRVMGLFMPIMREMVEMMYQFDKPYWLDSSKFEKAYNYSPVSYEQGIRDTIAFYNLKK